MAEVKVNSNAPETKQEGGGNRTRLYILLGVLVVIAAAAVAVNFLLLSPDESPPGTAGITSPAVSPPEETASLLPQLTRQEDEESAGKEAVRWETLDPFSLPMELMGVITGGKKDLAIIKARQTTYIASPGDLIAGTWELVEVNRNSVRLKNDADEIVVQLGPRE